MQRDGGLVKTVAVSIPYTATIVLTVAESAGRSIKMVSTYDAFREHFDKEHAELLMENHRLRQCLMHALNYRPLPSDPLQLFVKERCPDVIDQWEKMRKVNE